MPRPDQDLCIAVVTVPSIKKRDGSFVLALRVARKRSGKL